MTKPVRSLTLFAMGAFFLSAGVTTTPVAAAPIQDSDTTRPEIQNFDVFLDGHAAIARQLRSNPSLVNNEEYLENHQALLQYLQNHPNVREELQENPGAFVRQSERLEGPEARPPAADRDRGIGQGDRAGFDMFLDNHPDIARQVTDNPSLADNPQYLRKHPALQQFLQTHPDLRAQLAENPQAVLRTAPPLEPRESQEDVTGFDLFLDGHPEVAHQLSKDPSLADNPKYLRDHPGLQQFLQAHPDLRAELTENPQSVLRTEQRLESRETQSDMTGFDLFLDGHPEVARQLSKDPSLADNPQYLRDHPALQQFLQTHPELRAELTKNPQSVLRTERRLESRESQGDVARFDAFLDKHPQISRQLFEDPSLVRNQKYLEDHPELQQFLQTHPDLRAEVTENPRALMQSERQWDTRERARPDDFGRASGRGMARGELSAFDAFLDNHPGVAGELSKNPSLVNNEEYLESHPELQKLLSQNPEIQQQLKQNPQAFLNATTRMEDQHMVRPRPKPLRSDPNVLKQ